MVQPSVEAADHLAKDGIETCVVNAVLLSLSIPGDPGVGTNQTLNFTGRRDTWPAALFCA